MNFTSYQEDIDGEKLRQEDCRKRHINFMCTFTKTGWPIGIAAVQHLFFIFLYRLYLENDNNVI